MQDPSLLVDRSHAPLGEAVEGARQVAAKRLPAADGQSTYELALQNVDEMKRDNIRNTTSKAAAAVASIGNEPPDKIRVNGVEDLANGIASLAAILWMS
jgi:hypothetical protein